MADSDTELIRLVERTVLDTWHKNYALLRAPVNHACIHLLRVAQHFLRKPKLFANLDAVSYSMWQSKFFKAFSFALRWAYLECPRSSAARPEGPSGLDEAAQYLIFERGMPYAELASQHVAWSNDLLRAQVIPEDKIIIFGPPDPFDVATAAEEGAAAIRETQAEQLTFPETTFTSLFNDWQKHADWTDRGLEFDPSFVLKHERFSAMRDWMKLRVFPELEDGVELGQYTLGDLRHFLAAALTIAECIKTLELVVDERMGPDNGMGSWIFTMTAQRAVDWYTKATALPSEIVKTILDDLTGDLSRFHFSIAASPIIRIDDNVLIGQRLFASFRPEHFVTRAMTIGSGRRKYDYVSTLLESARLNVIEKRLREGGLCVLRECPFVTPEGKRFVPDFVVWDSECAEIIVLDFKNSLSATAPAEVVNRMREHRKGIEQVTSYLKLFRKNLPLLACHTRSLPKAPAIIGGLLYWTPLGLPVPRDGEVLTDHWRALLSRVGATGRITIADMQRKYGRDGDSGFKMTPIDVKVDEWTYRRFVFVKPAAT